MTVLIAFPEYPYPMNGGAKVALNAYIRAFADLGYLIDLIGFDTTAPDADRHVFRDVMLVPKPRRLRASALAITLITGESYLFRRFTSRSTRKAVSNFLRGRTYDAVLIAHSYMSGLFTCDFLASIEHKLLLSAEVLEGSALLRKAALVKSGVKRKLLQIEARRILRQEMSTLSRSIACFFYNGEERELYHSQTGRNNGHFIRLGLDLAKYRPQPRLSGGKPVLAFYGTFFWFPNVDALEYLLKEVWPVIRAANPGAVLRVAGRGLPLWAQSRADSETHILGEVRSIHEFIAQSDVVLAPVRIGGGTRLKILEAMALGRPVVASPESLEGIECKHGEAVAAATTSREYADAVTRLLENGQQWTAMTTAALKYIQAYHDYNTTLTPVFRRLGLAQGEVHSGS